MTSSLSLFAGVAVPVFSYIFIDIIHSFCPQSAGPFGTGSSTPSYGMCPIDAPWHSEDEFMTVRYVLDVMMMLYAYSVNLPYFA